MKTPRPSRTVGLCSLPLSSWSMVSSEWLVLDGDGGTSS